MANQDAEIGRAVLARREDLDVTQQVVADAMRERGWKWSQATMWAIEKGDRPLRLAEAVDLAEILGVTIFGLMKPQEPVEKKIDAELKSIGESFDAIRDLARSTFKRQRIAAILIKDAEAATGAYPDLEEDGGWVTVPLEDAVATARFEVEQGLNLDAAEYSLWERRRETESNWQKLTELMGEDYTALISEYMSQASQLDWLEVNEADPTDIDEARAKLKDLRDRLDEMDSLASVLSKAVSDRG